MSEYIDILEPQRMFAAEARAAQNRTSCLHSFAFATRRIYVNSAWGRDTGDGYEIPLFNPDDQSGFYSKPWFGPVTESGSNDLVRYWHEHPEDMVFYTSTVTGAGAGADTDTWSAVPGLDADTAPTFSNIATQTNAPTPENVKHKRMPAYHLGAADNPRFAMRVIAEGPSNIIHGRGTEKLVASVRVMHIERTMARSRLSFDETGPLQQVVGDTTSLWDSARASAEVKTVEATIARINEDANRLIASFGDAAALAASCDVLKQKLIAKIEESYNEACDRLGGPLDTALKAIDESAIEELVQAQRRQLRTALQGCVGIPQDLVKAACG